jgi:hypothetical protein
VAAAFGVEAARGVAAAFGVAAARGAAAAFGALARGFAAPAGRVARAFAGADFAALARTFGFAGAAFAALVEPRRPSGSGRVAGRLPSTLGGVLADFLDFFALPDLSVIRRGVEGTPKPQYSHRAVWARRFVESRKYRA